MTVGCVDVVTAYKAVDPVRASSAERTLSAEGISCVLEGLSQAGLAALAIHVRVRAGDADRAGKLLRSQAT
jgi:hypothetical protein